MSFELEIKKLRNKKDWTQKTLASMVGVVEATVSRWERGLHPPSDPEALLNRLAEYVSESDLAPLRAEIEKEKGPEIHQQAKAETHPVELDLEWLAEARRKRPSRILRPERPVFLVETSVLMDRFASADRLFQRARCGEEPWELMFRAVKNIEAWFKEQLPSKNDWAIQSSPKAPEPQISYRLEQYAEVESRLWDMLNVTDALCKDHAVTQEQKALYFKFTKTIKSIGRMHEAMLPGAGSANVICGSPQLYLRMRNYAPNAALSIILQMREDEAQSGNLRG